MIEEAAWFQDFTFDDDSTKESKRNAIALRAQTSAAEPARSEAVGESEQVAAKAVREKAETDVRDIGVSNRES